MKVSLGEKKSYLIQMNTNYADLGQCISSPLDNRTFSKVSIVCIHLYQVGFFFPQRHFHTMFLVNRPKERVKNNVLFFMKSAGFFFLIGLILLLVRS